MEAAIAMAAGILAGTLAGVAIVVGVKRGGGTDIAPALVGIIVSFAVLSISLIGVKLLLPSGVLAFGICAVVVFLAIATAYVLLTLRKD